MTEKKHSAHPFRKKVISLVLRIFLILLFLEFVVYFGSNLFLQGFAQRKINEATKDVYLVDFDRINFSLLRRGIFLSGLIMKPVDGIVQGPDQVLFDFTLDKAGFSGLWFNFFSQEFTVSKIYLDNPSIQMLLPPKPEGQKREKKGKKSISPVKLLENEIRKSVAKMNLVGFLVKEVEIDHANVFFFNFLSHGNLTAENTSLKVKNLDLTTTKEWETPFNAEGFVFELEKVTFPLPDGVHTIQSDRVYISSLEKLVDIQKFSMLSDRSRESKAYYDVDLDKLILGNVDLNKAFMTSDLEVDELILNSPRFRVASNPYSKSDSTASGDLNEFIKGNLNSISIKELAINKGQFSKSQIEDTLKNRIELEELNFKMVQFYLGEDSLKRANQFFYGEDASMEILGSKVYLGDEVHLLQGEKVSVSSFKDELIVTNLSIAPRPGAAEEKSPNNIFQISLPEFSFSEIDLKKLYNEGIFEVEEVLVNHPKVEFIELTKSEKVSEKTPFTQVIAGFLNLAEVKKFEVREGEIQFKDERGQRSNDIGFDKFSFILEGLSMDPTHGLPIQEQINAEEFFLSLDNYQLKLRDNLHLIKAGKLTVDSKNSLLEVQNLQIHPQSQEQIQTLLDTYGKTSAIDFSVPLFRAEGIDVQSAFYDQILKIERIYLPKPEFSIATYKKKVKSDSSVQSADDVKSILLGYFDSIVIDSVSMDQGKINYKSLADGKESSFEEDNLALRLKNFSLYPGDTSFTGKTLFSEEIDLLLSNYTFSLAGGKYLAETDHLRYNSKEESIIFKNLTLRPGENLESKIELGLDFPEVTFRGVDLEEFVFENVLDLEKLEINRGHIEIAIDRKITSKKPETANTKKIEKAIEWVNVDTIRARDSFLQLSFAGENNALKSVETGFEFSILDFHLDTTMVNQGDFGKIYSSADLDLKDFVFALPDSVHTISFSKVQFGDSRDEMLFSDLKIAPKDHVGKLGSPVVEAKIDQLGIVKNRLLDIFSTKRFDLKEIRMVNPKVDVYLDTLISTKKPKEKGTSTGQKKLVESIVFGDFKIENGDFKFHRKGQGPIPRLNFQKLNLHAQDLGLDVLDQNQELNLQNFAAKNLDFSLEEYHLTTPDSLYKISFGKVAFENRNLRLSNVYYRPVKGNYAHLRALPFQTDAISAKIDLIELKGLDPLAYFEQNKLNADLLAITHAEIDLFRDKRYPIDTTISKPMPQYLMSHAKINGDILALQVRDSRVRYFEFAPKGNLPGSIQFEDIGLDLAPFYLRKSEETYPVDKVRLGIEAKIMNESDVNLQSTMFFSEQFPMNVSLSMNKFSFVQVNDFLSKTLFVKALDGTVSEGKWDFVLNDDYSLGRMTFGYSNLKVQFVDSLTYERGKGKLKIYSFGANLFAKKNNPRGGKGKTISSRIFQERDKRKFVFSAWWKATFSGLRGTFGLGQPKVPKWMRKEDESSVQ